ncbi:MAG: tetratricopeptide repeat protein [Aridibacter famidurans]|nr:tetratricopeptide repeat protein [Aridibacter famidurans]
MINFRTVFLLIFILASFALAQTPSTAEDWRALAFKQMAEKKYETAERSFSECIRLDGSIYLCWRGRAGANFLLGKTQEAFSDVGKAIALAPRDSLSVALRGEINLRLGKTDQALTDYSSAIAIEPRPVYYTARGEAYLGVKRYKEAEADLTAAIGLEPQNSSAFRRRANIRSAAGNHQGAVEDLSNAIGLEPGNAQNYLSRGLSYEKLKKYKEAIDDYTKAIELDPKLAWAHNNRAFAYHQQRKYAQAEPDYLKAIAIDPSVPMFRRNLGDLYYDQEKYVEAEAAFKKAIELNPDFAWAHNNLGLTYHRQKKYTEALQTFDRALEIDPKYTAVMYNIGIVYRDMKDLEKAIEQFTKAVSVNERYVNAYKERGEAYTKLKRYEEALADFETLVKLEPANAARYVDRGAAFDRLGQTEKAAAEYDRALQLDPKQHYALFNKGVQAYQKKDHSAAADWAGKSIAANGTYGMAYRLRAISYCYLAKPDLAKADEAKAAELGTPVDKPCAATTLSAFESAKEAVGEGRHAEAVGLVDEVLADSSVVASVRQTRVFEIALLLEKAKQYGHAKDVLLKLQASPGLAKDISEKSTLALGNMSFKSGDHAKALEYYGKIPQNVDARTNSIRAFYQLKRFSEAASATASLVEAMAAQYYATQDPAAKKQWFDRTNALIRDAFGLAAEFEKLENGKPHAVVIYKAIGKVVPAQSPDGQIVTSRLNELGGGTQ